MAAVPSGTAALPRPSAQGAALLKLDHGMRLSPLSREMVLSLTKVPNGQLQPQFQ